MRIHLKTTPNDSLVTFDYQQKLVGILHKWLGSNNEEHGILSLYSFSWLHHGKKIENGLTFSEGATWFISFYNESRIKQIVKNILDNPVMFFGMAVSDVIIEETPDLSNRNFFYLGSPIFIKSSDLKFQVTKQYTFNDEEANGLMVHTLHHKMELAGLPYDESLDIRFDLDYQNKKTKMLKYRGIYNRANLCPVIIEGKPETKAFAWNVGIGNSTGIGFGSIY